MRSNLLKLAILTSCLSLLACGGGGDNQDAGTDAGDFLCSATSPCPEGKRCNSDQQCVQTEALIITTESLPDGRVDFSYDIRLQAEGGLPPYHWTIIEADPALTWMALGDSGRITGSPSEVAIDANVTVQVRDEALDGEEQAQATFPLSIILCQDGDRELCYVPEADICNQGVRVCTDGVMGDCTSNGQPSSDSLRCGADCSACDSAVADSCTEGLCTCGGQSLCDDGLRCCDGACIDIMQDVANCGSCFLDCHQAVAHVADDVIINCESGQCVFEGDCEHGFLNCDEVLPNGCETLVTLFNCGTCGIDCNDLVGHVSPNQRTCLDTETEEFVCGYDGSCSNEFADCDADGANGCEIYLNNPTDCGACDNNCLDGSLGQLCTSPNPTNLFEHECGCRFDTATGLPDGCDAGQICCSRACQDCARHCFEGGADAVHCGICDAACDNGETCNNGGCTCGQGSCPSPSGATTCQAGQCICAESGAANAPCPIGYFCCDGSEGGTGGSAEENGEEPDTGCCRKRCGQNDWENFPCIR